MFDKHNFMLIILYAMLRMVYILSRECRDAEQLIERRHSFTQIELAKRVSVTRQTIGFIEKGEFSPSMTLSLKLARALDCDINELFWLVV